MREPCIVYHGAGAEPSLFEAGAPVAMQWRAVDELLAHADADKPAILLADTSVLEHAPALRDAAPHIVVVAADAEAAVSLGDRIDISIAELSDAACRAGVLTAACQLAASRVENARLGRELRRSNDEFDEMIRIGIATMHERDRNALIKLIVTQGKRLTDSDGGGVVFVRDAVNGGQELYAVAYEIDALPNLGLPPVTYPLDGTSIVGHAALTKHPVIIDDVSSLPPSTAYVASTEFRRRYKYRARSMMAVPMLTQRDEVLGVILFINRKSDPHATIATEADADRYVLPYTERHARITRALASIAALAIESGRLYRQIEQMLESIVKAAVSAIDARDPSTAGHSVRVAELAVAIAEAVDRIDRGPYRDTHFTTPQLRELRYAALLHDLGKVTVPEAVLVKAKKLPPNVLERIAARFDLIRETIRVEHCDDPDDARLAKRLCEVDRMEAIIRAANEPTMEVRKANGALADIAKQTFRLTDGTSQPFLTPEELAYLEITSGTLNAKERAAIESHVDRTQRFLSQIPWTDDLKNIVTFACGHHEKLDGSGYPARLTADRIPLQTRMITLADIFDALTEGDRPYKPAVTADRALDIIREEARAGLLDRDLVDIMVETKVYRRILGDEWRPM
jgi:HD-GYP domain-containing protein (c-di-GMP phosphodiesterase class II)